MTKISTDISESAYGNSKMAIRPAACRSSDDGTRSLPPAGPNSGSCRNLQFCGSRNNHRRARCPPRTNRGSAESPSLHCLPDGGPPEADGIRIQDGKLILKGSRAPLSDVRARNILVRRQCNFCFKAEAEFEVPELCDGQEAGITCYYDENTWVCFYVSKEKENYFLQVKEHIGKEDISHTKEELINPVGEQYILGVETRYLRRQFYYGKIGKERKNVTELTNVYYLCDEGISMGKRFTGAMVGMYGYAGDNSLFIKFETFHYQELPE